MATVKESEVMDRYRRKKSGSTYFPTGLILVASFLGVLGIFVFTPAFQVHIPGVATTLRLEVGMDHFLKCIGVIAITFGLVGFVYGILIADSSTFVRIYSPLFSAGLALYAQSGWAILSMTLLFIVVLLPDIYAKMIKQRNADSKTE